MLKISHGTRILDQSDKNGYGYATSMMLESLSRLGYETAQNDGSADVEIWFDQPHHWNFSKGVYRIGYHPWESTALLATEKPDWTEQMNACDEIWTPSPIIAEWYKSYMNIKPPVYVYEHGVSPKWKQREKRQVDGTFKFLHIGAEAARKGAKEAMQGLRLAFPRDTDVELNMKIISQGWHIGVLPRINMLNGIYDFDKLLDLYYDNHVFLYPSYGEGFGLTPLQAMASGMPTITLPAWAPYADFIDPNLAVGSTLSRSPWPAIHPGMMWHPNTDSLVESMRYAYHNYDQVQASASAKVDDILERYDWDSLTKKAFGDLEKRL